MVRKLVNLITIDFEKFKLSQIKQQLFNNMYMTLAQHESLVKLLSESKPEIDNIIAVHKPDKYEMDLMGVKRNDLGYRNIEVSLKIDEKTKLLRDWSYKVCYLTRDEEDGIKMAVGDRCYTREEARKMR